MGVGWASSTKELEALAAERRCPVLGTFGCKGYDTFGPFSWWVASLRAAPTRLTWNRPPLLSGNPRGL